MAGFHRVTACTVHHHKRTGKANLDIALPCIMCRTMPQTSRRSPEPRARRAHLAATSTAVGGLCHACFHRAVVTPPRNAQLYVSVCTLPEGKPYVRTADSPGGGSIDRPGGGSFCTHPIISTSCLTAWATPPLCCCRAVPHSRTSHHRQPLMCLHTIAQLLFHTICVNNTPPRRNSQVWPQRHPPRNT